MKKRHAHFILLAAAMATASRGATLATGEPLAAVSAHLAAEGTGTVTDEGGGWYRFDPAAEPPSTATVSLDFSSARFRAFNQVLVTVSNANASTYMTATLDTARPKWTSDVKTSFTADRGVSSHEIYFPGIGAPARLRDFRLVLHHGSEDRPDSVAAAPVRVRVRMRLTDYNINATLWNALAGHLEATLPEGLSSGAQAAADARRAELSAQYSSLRATARSSSSSNAEKLEAYDALFTMRDAAARAIERAALDTDAAAAESAGSLLHGVCDGCEKVPRDGAFPGTVGGKLSISAARGEAEGGQICLFPASNIASVSAILSRLRSATGAVLPADCATIAPVGYVRTTPPACHPRSDDRDLVADALLTHISSVDLESGTVQPFWLDVSVLRTAAPGVYNGSVRFVDASGAHALRVPVSVTVRRFALSSHRTLPVVFSSTPFSATSALSVLYEWDGAVLDEFAAFLSSEGDGDPSVLSDRARAAWERCLAHHRLLVEHNVPPQAIYRSVGTTRPAWLRNLLLEADPTLYCLGYDNRSPVVDHVGVQVAPMRDDGTSGAAFLYGYDEITSASAFASMKEDYAAVKAAYPEVRTMCTALDGSFGENTDTTEEVDVWVDPVDRYRGHAAAAARARARGKEVWFYPCNWPVHPNANFHLENTAAASRMLMGAYAWKYATDGVLYYCTDDIARYTDTSVLSYAWNESSGPVERVRRGNRGWDVELRMRPTANESSCKVARWQDVRTGIDWPAPVRVRGEVRVDALPSGSSCSVELRFLYTNKARGNSSVAGQEQNYVRFTAPTGGWVSFDETFAPEGTVASCYFALRASGAGADVSFRDVRIEDAAGATVPRRISAHEPVGDGPVLEDACYGHFRSNGDGCLVYPGPDGALPSLRLKFVRDGIDDWEYLHALSNAVLLVRGGGVAPASGTADWLSRAETLLAVPADVCNGLTGYPERGADLVAFRDSVADLLDECEAAQGTGETEPVSLFESFEEFDGASGTTVDGFAGDGGTGLWSASGSVVVRGDGTARHGDAYLRLADDDSNQHNAAFVLSASFSFLVPAEGEGDADGGEGVPFSFSFRRTPAPESTAYLTGCKLKMSWFSAVSNAWASTSDGTDLFSLPAVAETGAWVDFSGRVARLPGPSSSRIGFRVESLRDAATGRILWRGEAGAAPWFLHLDTQLPGDTLRFRGYTFFTYSSGQGFIDIDAIRFGDPPSEPMLTLIR